MKKKIFQYFLIGLIIIFLSSLSSCLSKREILQTEYFTYVIKGSGDDKFVDIWELTDKGKEQEIIVIPGYIDGIKVLSIGNARIMYHLIPRYLAFFSSEKLKRVYIEIEEIWLNKAFNPDFFSYKCPNFDKVIFILYDYVDKRPSIGRMQSVFFRSDYINSEKYMFFFDEKEKKIMLDEYTDLPANVSYYHNYQNAPREGYYWIDDYDNELIQYIPKDPQREGYTFAGWYKESECLERWNFEIDKIPQKIIEEASNTDKYQLYTYRETKLYAKWNENE